MGINIEKKTYIKYGDYQKNIEKILKENLLQENRIHCM